MNWFKLIIWDPAGHTDEENIQWSRLRAIEWRCWPVYVTAPFAPLLFIFYDWWKYLLILLVLNICWTIFVVKRHYVILKLANLTLYLRLINWISCPVAAIYFIIQKNSLLAVLSIIWPGLSGAIGALFAIGSATHEIQELFMRKLEGQT